MDASHSIGLPVVATSSTSKPARSAIWRIEEGAVIGETKEDPKYNTFFCSKKKYSDFEMTCKLRLRDGVGNSGIQIRSTVTNRDRFTVAGPQVDVGKACPGVGRDEGWRHPAVDGEIAHVFDRQFPIRGERNHRIIALSLAG